MCWKVRYPKSLSLSAFSFRGISLPRILSHLQTDTILPDFRCFLFFFSCLQFLPWLTAMSNAMWGRNYSATRLIMWVGLQFRKLGVGEVISGLVDENLVNTVSGGLCQIRALCLYPAMWMEEVLQRTHSHGSLQGSADLCLRPADQCQLPDGPLLCFYVHPGGDRYLSLLLQLKWKWL